MLSPLVLHPTQHGVTTHDLVISIPRASPISNCAGTTITTRLWNQNGSSEDIMMGDASMTLDRTKPGLAVMALLCVATIFFFPSIQGPYSAVHGPVSALQANRAATRLRIAITQALVVVSPTDLISSPALFLFPALDTPGSPSVAVADLELILRC